MADYFQIFGSYAYCLLREDFRLFKINRISFYKILPDNFIPKKVVVPSLEIDDTKKIYGNKAPNKYHVILEFKLQDKEFLIEALDTKYKGTFIAEKPELKVWEHIASKKKNL
ncbi:hypothetical protein V6615_15380 [Oscillospiraceae bacterium PP1C4]